LAGVMKILMLVITSILIPLILNMKKLGLIELIIK